MRTANGYLSATELVVPSLIDVKTRFSVFAEITHKLTLPFHVPALDKVLYRPPDYDSYHENANISKGRTVIRNHGVGVGG